jgi:hypothetical protein
MASRRRFWSAVLVALLCALTGGSGAHAQSQPLTGLCSFPITHDLPFVNVRTHEFFDKPTPFEVVEAGPVFVVVTNLDNGKSVTIRANAVTLYSQGGGTTAYYRGQGLTFFDSDRGEIPQGVWVTAGSWFLTFDSDFRVATATGGVLRRDICAELA